MKVRINSEITVDVKVTQTMVCPAGKAYWQIDYIVDGYCIHSATTGAIYGSPDVIAMLDRKYTYSVEHDMSDPVPTGTDHKIRYWHSERGDFWAEEFAATHREAIIKACNQLIIS